MKRILILLLLISKIFSLDYFDNALIESDSLYYNFPDDGMYLLAAIEYDSTSRVLINDYFGSNSDSTDKILYYYDSSMYKILVKQIKYNGDTCTWDSVSSPEPLVKVFHTISHITGETSLKRKMWFDSNMNIQKDSIIDIDHPRPYYSTYSYDANDNLILFERFLLDDSSIEKEESSFDNNKLKEIKYYYGQMHRGKDSLYYEDDGRLSSIKYFGFDTTDLNYTFVFETLFKKSDNSPVLSKYNQITKSTPYTVKLNGRNLEIRGDKFKNVEVFNLQGKCLYKYDGIETSYLSVNLTIRGISLIKVDNDIFKGIQP